MSALFAAPKPKVTKPAAVLNVQPHDPTRGGVPVAARTQPTVQQRLQQGISEARLGDYGPALLTG